MPGSERVLILRNQGIGDLILITPAIRAIRQLHPKAHIAVMVGAWSKVALENNPHLSEIIAYPDPWIQNKQPWGYIRLVARLFNKFDTAYIFHSHPFIHLLPYLARVHRRFGFFNPELKKQGSLLTAKTEWQPNTDRYIADNYLDIPRLAGFVGNDLSLDFFLDADELKQAEKLLSDLQIQPKQFIIIAPGGGVNPRQQVFEKRWGEAKFAKLCDLLLANTGLPIILTGSPSEMEIGAYITKHTTAKVIDLIGEISFRLTAALVKCTRFLICNDSAVMHVAVAFSIPSLTIFGPSNPKSLLPVSLRNQWITSGLDCSPCYCNSIFTGCEHLRCMEELTPEKVHGRIVEMFKQ